MRIGIDVRRMCGQRTGVGVYTASLVKVLTDIDGKNTYYPFFAGSQTFLSLDALVKELFWKQLILPIILFVRKIDVFFCPNPPVPFFSLRPSVVTIHDVEVPDRAEWLSRIMFILYYFTAMKAAKVIVPSLNTKKDTMRILHVPEEKIVVAYNGIDHEKFKPLNRERAREYIKRKYGISGAFILSVVNGFTVRKNVLTLLNAYHKLPDDPELQYELVIVGKKKGSQYKRVLETIDHLNLKDRVTLTGYVPEDDLPLLYNAASLFVFLSLYEGFGLTPLEAMACGTPVIVSKTSSLPEVIGDAGVMVNPNSSVEVSRTMSQVLTDSHLREMLKEKGLKRAELFSWEKSAVSLLTVLESIT
jgi:glycosyltransferase involved in cell wall biosynthesis